MRLLPALLLALFSIPASLQAQHVVDVRELQATDGILYIDDSGTLFTGTVREIYPNGVIKSDQQVEEGVRTGARKEWYPNGVDKLGEAPPDAATALKVTLLAGAWREQGSRDGFGPDARFKDLNGAAVDENGVLYVLDQNKIRKITPDGMVTTLAGSDQGGYRNGTGVEARFCKPLGITLDRSGNLYVTDNYNAKIRKITPDGTVTTFASNAPAFQIPGGVSDTVCKYKLQNRNVDYPAGIAVADDGTVFVALQNGHRIIKVTADGEETEIARKGRNGDYRDGQGTDARFDRPTSVSLDAEGNLLVSDAGNRRLRYVDADGTVSTYGDKLGRLGGSAVAENGDVYFVDNGATIRVAPRGEDARVFAGGKKGYLDGPVGSARFQTVTGIAVDGKGNLIVADRNNHRIRKISPDGAVSTLAGNIGKDGVWYGKNSQGEEYGSRNGAREVAQLFFPNRVATDAAGNVFVSESTKHRIRKIAPDGMVSTLAGTGVKGSSDGAANEATFNKPNGLAVDNSGNVYVADTGNNRIRKIAADGTVSTLAGSTAGYADGPGQDALFDAPNDVVVRGDGVIFVADTENNNVRQISTDGTVSTLAGSTRGYHFAHLRPYDLVLDSDGNLFVSNTTEHVIVRISPSDDSYEVFDFAGGKPTKRGASPQRGFADGQGSNARFYHPGEIAIDGSGNLYVADIGNRVIRKITPDGTVTRIKAEHRSEWMGKPSGIAVSADGVLYVLDGPNHRVFKAEFPPAQQ